MKTLKYEKKYDGLELRETVVNMSLDPNNEIDNVIYYLICAQEKFNNSELLAFKGRIESASNKLYKFIKNMENKEIPEEEFEQKRVYRAGLEFDNSFEKILVKNKYLLSTLENILIKNNLEIKENINPENIMSILEYSLYNKKNKLIKKFFSSDNFGSAERIYFYVLENYN